MKKIKIGRKIEDKVVNISAFPHLNIPKTLTKKVQNKTIKKVKNLRRMMMIRPTPTIKSKTPQLKLFNLVWESNLILT